MKHLKNLAKIDLIVLGVSICWTASIWIQDIPDADAWLKAIPILTLFFLAWTIAATGDILLILGKLKGLWFSAFAAIAPLIYSIRGLYISAQIIPEALGFEPSLQKMAHFAYELIIPDALHLIYNLLFLLLLFILRQKLLKPGSHNADRVNGA